MGIFDKGGFLGRKCTPELFYTFIHSQEIPIMYLDTMTRDVYYDD